MRTSKTIATISYNTPDFLIYKLNELIDRKKISDWMFIKHTAEQDEKKDHIHLWIKPNTLLDTMDLQNHFKEVVFESEKPLKCIDFVNSSTDDWILYCQHFRPYLASKGQSREFCYTREDFVFYDVDNFDYNYEHAFKASEWAQKWQMLEFLNDPEIAPADLIKKGMLSLNMASQLNALKALERNYGSTYRNGRKGHE